MKSKDRKFIIEFLAPAVIMFVIIFVYPLIRTIAMSFFSVENITGELKYWIPVGIHNYVKLFQTPIFVQVFTNLIKIWLLGGIIVMLIALLFAVILNSGIKGKSFFRSVIYMPYTISTVAMALMWIEYAYNPNFGLLTKFFTLIGADNLAAIEWMGADHKFISMFIAYCFGAVGYHMIIFSSGIEAIPQEYYEAARIDGCNKIKEFANITWPMIQGVLKTNIIMWSIECAGFYTWSMMFTSDGKVDGATGSPVAYMYLKLFGGSFSVTDRDAGLAAAVGVITGLFILVCFLVTTKLIKNDDLEL